MRMILFCLAIACTAVASTAQSWTYKKGGDPFDGEYRTSLATGKSSNTTYIRPLFVVNNFNNSKDFNIYISNVGYFCDNVSVKFIFDQSKTVYYCSASESNKSEAVFLSGFYFYDSENRRTNISVFEFLELAKKHSKMHVRLEDDCDRENLEFSLSGSTTAINYVYGGRAADISMEIVRAQKQRVENLKLQKEMKAKEGRLEEARMNLTPGPAYLKLNKGGKMVLLWDVAGINGKIIGKVYENDTIEIISKDQNYFLIETRDTIIGYCQEGFIYPLNY